MKWFCILLILGVTNSCNIHAQENSNFPNMPLEVSSFHGTNDVLVVYLTGDGGWNNFSQGFAKELEKTGYAVVTLNTRDYFWKEKSADTFTKDIEKISKFYLDQWHKKHLLFIGYSFGADVTSFLPNLLSQELKQKVEKVVLLSPSASTDFEIHLADMIGYKEHIKRKYEVQPQIENSSLPILCVFGKEEQLQIKNKLLKGKNRAIIDLPGDHQYQENFDLLTNLIKNHKI